MKKGKMIIMTAAAAAMLVQTTAMAEPLDELNEILTATPELKQETLLSETLGLTQIKELIKENGIDIHWKGGLTDGTAEILGVQDNIPEGSYAELGFQLDRNAQNWKVEAGLGTAEEVLGNLALYGDHDVLQLAIPQLYDGAVALHAGNLKEQYENSALSALLGEDYSAVIPELNMRFYPEAADLDLMNTLTASFTEALAQEAAEIEEQVQVEKAENGDEVIYTMTCPSEVIKEVYASFFEGYIGLVSQFNAVDTYELSEMEDELDQMIEEVFAVLPEEIDVDFFTKEGLLEKIYYELYLDTEAMEAVNGDVVEGVLDEAGTAQDAAGETDGFKGTAAYEIAYTDPSDPAAGMEIHMTMTDDTAGEYADVLVQLATATEGTVSETTLTAAISVAGEPVYTGTLYTQTFDALTGDLDMSLAVQADPEGMIGEAEAAELPVLTLDSTFTEIEPGVGFTWTADGLTLSADGESIGITSELTVSAKPEAITDLQPEYAILEMDETELTTFIMEIYMNAQNWLSEHTTETDALTNDAVTEEADAIESAIDEAEDGSKTAAIIGGADGPTSIFLAGKMS